MKNPQPTPRLTLLYDGQCPICSKKIAWILARAKEKTIETADISSPDFSHEKYGIPPKNLQKEIHAIDGNGRILKGMEVFRATYSAIGLGWLAAPTAWFPFRPLFDFFYRTIARNRKKILFWTVKQCSKGDAKK